MNRNFFTIPLLSFLILYPTGWAVDTAGVRLKLIEMSEIQAIELNLEMDAERVGRKENGDPVFLQIVNGDFEKKLAEFENVLIVPAPQLTVQLSRRGEIKMGKDFRFPKSLNPANGRVDIGEEFLGYEIIVVPFAGSGDIAVDVALKVIHRELSKEGELTDEGVTLPEFHESKMESRMIVTSGKTVCFGEFTKRNGRKVMIVGTVLR